MKSDFTWTSTLGVSCIMFISIAVIYILIGVLGIILIGKYGAGNLADQFYYGKEADELIFGKPTKIVALENPHFAKYISRLMIIFCSFMVGMGVLQFGIARFSLTEAEWWAYWVSLFGNVFMLSIYWIVIISPVLKEFNLGYFKVWHPYAFIPTLLLPVAGILGWLALIRK